MARKKRAGKKRGEKQRHLTLAGRNRAAVRALSPGDFKPNRNQTAALHVALDNPTIALNKTQIAALTDLGLSTVKRWWRDPGFRTWWHTSIQIACQEMGGPMLLALAGVVQDSETPAAVKAKAAEAFLKLTGGATPSPVQSQSIVAFLNHFHVSVDAGRDGAEVIRQIGDGPPPYALPSGGSDNGRYDKQRPKSVAIPHYFAAVEATPQGAEAAARGALAAIDLAVEDELEAEGEGGGYPPVHGVTILSEPEVQAARSELAGRGEEITRPTPERERPLRGPSPSDPPSPASPHPSSSSTLDSPESPDIVDLRARANPRPLSIPSIEDGEDVPPTWVDLVGDDDED